MSRDRVARAVARCVATLGARAARGARCGAAGTSRRGVEDVETMGHHRLEHRTRRRGYGATGREDEDAVVRALRAMAPEARARALGAVMGADAATRSAVMATLASAGTLDRAFEDADANGDGVLDKKEFLMALSRDERRDGGSGGGDGGERERDGGAVASGGAESGGAVRGVRAVR